MNTFPTPYKDELLYSVLARYSVRSGNSKSVSNLDDLYGHRRIIPTFHIPSNINVLCDRLPSKSLITPELIVKNHSLIPFFAAFLNVQEVNDIFNVLKEGNTSGVYMKMAILNQGGPINSHYHHCSKCMEEDFEHYGETFWHRDHQINGVFVCSKHHEMLFNTNILIKGVNRQKLMPATKDIKKNMSNYRFTDKTIEHLFLLSNDISNLLNNEFPKVNRIQTAMIFNEKLIEQGYAKLNNYIHQKSLIEDFHDFYGEEFLDLFFCKIDNFHVNWLSNMIRSKDRKQYALKYLLLTRFLGMDINDMFSNYNADLFEPTQNEWDQNLIELASHKISIRQIGKTIGSNTKTIRKAFERLGVDPYWNIEQVSRKNHSTYIGSDQFNELLKNRREIWLNYLEDNMDLGTSQIKYLNKEASMIYYWLTKYDKNWMMSHHRKSAKADKIIDWKLRDDEYYPLVDELIKEMKNGKPEIISCNIIASKLGLKGWLCKSVEKLPKIKSLIDGNFETIDQYRIRKILWAINQINEESQTFNLSKVVEKTGINHKTIKKYIDEYRLLDDNVLNE